MYDIFCFQFLDDLWLLGTGHCTVIFSHGETTIEYLTVCFNVSRNPFFIPSELVMRRVMALKRNSRESNENQMFLHLQNSFQNVPVFSSLSMNKVNASKESCSIYPNILDINFSNKYWQIFKNGSSTLHLYGAYFGKLFCFLVLYGPINWSTSLPLPIHIHIYLQVK